jgi:hypothetical protein
MRFNSPKTAKSLRNCSKSWTSLHLNAPSGSHARTDGAEIRKAAIAMNVPLLTTLSATMAAVSAIQALGKKELKYRSLQSHFGGNND